jgi:hypothetical protein
VVSHSHYIRTDSKNLQSARDQIEDLTYFIRDALKDTFILVEDKRGNYLTLRIKKDNSDDQIRLQMY